MAGTPSSMKSRSVERAPKASLSNAAHNRHASQIRCDNSAPEPTILRGLARKASATRRAQDHGAGGGCVQIIFRESKARPDFQHRERTEGLTQLPRESSGGREV